MFYSPDSELSGANISTNFPYGIHQPASDFTLYGDPVLELHGMMNLPSQQVYPTLAQRQAPKEMD